MDFKTRFQLVLNKFKKSPPQITTKYLYFLGGFLEGEGCLCVSIKNKQNKKIRVDPEFNICQHQKGIIHLIGFMFFFKTGGISFKTGSNATYVYKITNRKALKEKFIPYYKKYVFPFASQEKNQRFYIFQKIIDLFEQKVHLNKKGLAFQILPLVYEMSDNRKKTLKQLQDSVLIDY
uniref:Homing endonuclease LAGLIDADG domain-containing protein n=1 Tax=Caulerpa manorensis TaxID=717648 RepID=A0A2P0QID3_9CHLO|nr:hypothetical protein [Caulerpa manorensis]ARO74493.1 hypothetical protein [Caulerpa manorensis]